MADVLEDNGSGFSKNRKREYRGTMAAAFSDSVFFLLDPSKSTKIHVVKNSEEVKVEVSSDTKSFNGGSTLTQITATSVLADTSILYNTVDDDTTVDYYAKDDGLSIVKLTPTGTPGASAMQYNVTQDGN